MGKLNNMIITSAGDSLLTRAMAGAAMSFTCGKTSGYQYPGNYDFKELSKQEEAVQTAEVIVNIVSKTEISITLRFSNADVAKDYYIWNVGIYAADGENEILFGIIPFSEADEMPAFSGKDKGTTYIYNPSIVISDTSNITLSINQSGTATVEDINRIEYPEFLEAANRVNISSKESMQSILGKIKKWFSDLKSVAFTGSYRDLTDTPVQPESLKNPNPIRVNGKTYDGSVLVDAGSIGIAFGGTGATTAAAARTNLGLGDVATYNVVNNSTTTVPGFALDARTATDLRQRIDTHTGNAAVHLTDAERTKWNGKQDKMTVDSALSTTSLNSVQNKVVTAKVNEINSNLSGVSQNLNGTVFIREGSGADTKYYIQTGADAASKKELGRPRRILLYSNKQMSGSWNDFYFEVPQVRSDATIADFGISIRSFSSKNQTSVPYELSYRYDAVNKKVHMATSIEFANAWAPYADLYYWEY